MATCDGDRPASLATWSTASMIRCFSGVMFSVF